MKYKFLPVFLIATESLIVTPFVMSCSTNYFESLRSQMANLLNQKNIVKIIIKQQPNISIDKLFDLSNLESNFETLWIQEIDEWNKKIQNDSKLNETEKNLLKFNRKSIRTIVIPSLTNSKNEEINSLKFKVNIANGPFFDDNILITDYQLDLNDPAQPGIENRKFTNLNLNQLSSSPNNFLNSSLKLAIKNHLKNNSITLDEVTKDIKKLNFKLDEKDFVDKVFWQNNMYTLIDETNTNVESKNFSFFVYFANQSENNVQISDKFLYYKIDYKEGEDNLFS